MKETISKLKQKVLKKPELRNLFKHRIQHDQVLILPVEIEESSKVASPMQYDDKPEWGIVLGAGEGRLLESGAVHAINVKCGDFVLFAKYGAVKVRTDGVDVLFVRQEDIISIYNE
jgi:chaperonin GroES